MANEFLALPIAQVRRETADAISIALAVPQTLAERFRFKPGQHVPVRAMIGGEEVRRTYSICSGPGDPHLRIAIKRLPNGRFSTWAHDTLAAGMSLEVMPPQGRFVLQPGDGMPCHLLAIASGAGITPIFAMLTYALTYEPHTRVTLLYGNRTMEDVIFRAALEDLKDRHMGRFAIVHVLSREESETPMLAGRITPQKLSEFALGLVDFGSVARAFVCGPGQMIRELRNQLFAMGLPRDRVHHEFFAAGIPNAPSVAHPQPARDAPSVAHSQPARNAPKHAPTPVAAQQQPDTEIKGAREIVAVLDGVRHRIEARHGEAVLDAVLRAGIRAPYACKGGMCCTCRARIVEGQAQMRLNYSLEPWEIEKGFTLTCQAVPQSPHLVVDYDAM